MQHLYVGAALLLVTVPIAPALGGAAGGDQAAATDAGLQLVQNGDAAATAESDADVAAVMNRLEELIDDERYAEAYDLARESRSELEGEVMFDFFYGLAAIETDHLSEGVFALERVVMQRPGFARGRLELARAQFMSGDDRRAKRNFERVLEQEPPAPVEATINRYLQAIRNRADRYSTVVRGHLEAGLGQDSNVNSATDQDSVFSDTFGQDLQLAEDDQELDDGFGRVAGQVRVSRPVAGSTTGFLSASAEERRNFDEDEFDTRTANAAAGAVIRGDRLETQLQARYQHFWLDGDSYRQLAGVGVDLRYSLSGRTVLLGGLQYADIEYDDLDDRDVGLVLGSAGISHVWQAPLRPVTSVTVFAGEESADADSVAADARAERDLVGVQAGLGLTLARAWRLDTRYQLRNAEYGGDDPLFAKTRDDDFQQVTLDLYWQPNAAWRVGPHVRYADNDSNIGLYDYDRELYEFRVRYSF